MATRKSEKKKKKAAAKKPVPKPLVKKKVSRPKITKPLKKKLVRKPMKVSVRPQEPIQPSPTPAHEKASVRKLLTDMREKLLAEISETRVPESLTATSEIGDLVDQAGDERDRELSLLLSDRDKEKLLAINEALEKIKEGSYGICEECGEKIGQGRLRVMPLAKYCVNCQSKVEKEISLQRKAEEELKYRGLAYASNTEEEEG